MTGNDRSGLLTYISLLYPGGQFLIIAVPTGIVTVEMTQAFKARPLRACSGCSADNHG